MNRNEKGKIYADFFRKLPEKCQEMFFEELLNEVDKKEALSSKLGLTDYLKIYDFDFTECKSPIEQIFKMAFDLFVFENDIPLYAFPQSEIHINSNTYYADFEIFMDDYMEGHGLRFENNVKMIVECDGHDFHKKNKTQVMRDNERDMNFKMDGYEVVRFSGTQIFLDPYKCVKETIKLYLLKGGKICQM